MGERTSLESGYCGTAEQIMEFAAHQNMAAGARNRVLSPERRPRYPKIPLDVDDPIIKTRRAAARAADALLEQCTVCDLSAIRPGAADQPCPLREEFAQLEGDTKSQIETLRAS